MKIWTFRYTLKKFVRKLADSRALWLSPISQVRLNWLFTERSSSCRHFQNCSDAWHQCSSLNASCMVNIQEKALKCVYSNHTASYESFLNKSRFSSLEVGRQINIANQTFKILNDLSPTYLQELIEKHYRTRNLRNSEKTLKIPPMKKVRHGTNYFCFLASKIWNILQEALRISWDLPTFRDGLRAYFSIYLRV